MEIERDYLITEQLKPFYGSRSKKMTLDEYIIKYYEMGTPKTETINGELQCKSGRRRSFMDMYYICRAKFPNIEKGEVFKSMLTLVYNEYIGVFFCSHVQKFVSSKWTPGCLRLLINNDNKFEVISGDKYMGVKAVGVDGIDINYVIEEANKFN